MRIVSLLSSATEMLFALGLGRQVLAVSHECDFPAAARALPKATRSRINSSRSSLAIDREVAALSAAGAPLYAVDEGLVTGLRPDLIVTQAQCDVCAVRYQDVLDLVASRPELADTRVLALNPLSLEEILVDIERVGAAAEAVPAAAAFVGGLNGRIERVRSATAELSVGERPRVVCLEWLAPLMAAGNWTPDLVALAGGISGLAIGGQHSGYVDPQAVLDFDPQVLIASPCGFDLPRTIEEAQVLLTYPFWGKIAACRAGRVAALDGNAYLNRSGPRIVDSLEILAHLLHPARCEPPAVAENHAAPWCALVERGGRLQPVEWADHARCRN